MWGCRGVFPFCFGQKLPGFVALGHPGLCGVLREWGEAASQAEQVVKGRKLLAPGEGKREG